MDVHITNILLGAAAVLAIIGGAASFMVRLIERRGRRRLADEMLWGTPADERRGIPERPGILMQLLPDADGETIHQKLNAIRRTANATKHRLEEHLEDHRQHPVTTP